MSTRGLLARIYGGMAIGAAAVALVVGCASVMREQSHAGGVLAAGQAHGPWATPAELDWLRRLGVWESALMRSLDRAARAPNEGLAENVAGPIRRCAHDLHFSVGDAPTARTQRALDTLEQACGHLERAVTSTNSETAAREGHRGGDALLRADQLLPPGEMRSLPVIAGAAVESHIDPKFSRIASDLAGKDVEVRCWSRVDWTRLLREENVYTLHHIDNGTLGFAGINGSRENLAPEICDGLDELAYQRRMPRDAGAKALLASAIVTLAHEPQHSKGVAVEAQAECYAIQLMTETAVKLGATAPYAAVLQRLYWSHYDEELPSYRSAACRDGGKYDLHPQRAAFP
jgi:hypothetical protein